MNPLELTVYPPFEHDWQIDKRFTDAELAAELHAQREAWSQALYDDVYSRYVEEERSLTSSRERLAMGNKAVTLHRFATLPHYDEADQ